MGLTNDLYCVVFAPSTSLTDERLFELMEHLRGLPDTDLPGPPEDRAGTDFLDHIDGYPFMVNGLYIVLDAYVPGKQENPLGVPGDIGYLVISVLQSSLVGMPEQYQALLEVLKEAFIALDAFHAYTIQEYELTAGELTWEDLRSHLGGVHLFSGEVVNGIGRDRLLSHAPDGGAFGDGGVWLRFQEEFFYGMPIEYQEGMRELLEEMWERR